MIRSIYRSGAGPVYHSLDRSQFVEALKDQNGTLWLDIVPHAEKPQETSEFLRSLFPFHPLAIDDALNESHVPRIDDWQNYLYVVLNALQLEINLDLDYSELDVFLGSNYVVTIHAEPIPAIDHQWQLCDRGVDRRLGSGPDHLLYAIIDNVVADYMLVVDKLEEEIEGIEDAVFGKPSSQTISRISRLRRTLLKLRRTIAATREVLNKLARDDFHVIDPGDRVYFRDVYDHLVRLYDIADGLRDMAAGALESYLSVSSNRLNEVMRTLTIVTVLFAPLSFLTGFFGMNFFAEEFNVSNPLTPRLVFAFAMLLMAAAPITMLLWMKRRGWLQRGIRHQLDERGDPLL